MTIRRLDASYCRGLLKSGSRSFFLASLCLPARLREPAAAVYAFCRTADDAVDLGSDGVRALDHLRRRLAAIYEGGSAADPSDRAFAVVVERFSIPRALPEALIEGFEWDVLGRRYESLAMLETYAARVAGTVGAMMTLVMGRREPSIVARGCELGVAMQLTNIARDVGEDARAGRLYLPLDWLREAGVDADVFLARPWHGAPLAAVVQRLLAAADKIYARADPGIDRLPGDCRPAIRAARTLYAEIGREVERRGLDSVSQRAVVGVGRKALLLATALARGPLRRAPAAALDSVRFLVDEVTRHPAASGWGPDVDLIEGRVAWLVELFARLERHDREAAQRPEYSQARR